MRVSTDIGELSAESQTAINQLADLGITQGTSATTYSPDDAVKRGHMALFIARLMDLMDPMAEDSDHRCSRYTPAPCGLHKDDDDSTADVDESKTVEVLRSPTYRRRQPRKPMTRSPRCGRWVLLQVSPPRPMVLRVISPVRRWPISWPVCWITPTPARLV